MPEAIISLCKLRELSINNIWGIQTLEISSAAKVTKLAMTGKLVSPSKIYAHLGGFENRTIA